MLTSAKDAKDAKLLAEWADIRTQIESALNNPKLSYECKESYLRVMKWSSLQRMPSRYQDHEIQSSSW